MNTNKFYEHPNIIYLDKNIVKIYEFDYIEYINLSNYIEFPYTQYKPHKKVVGQNLKMMILLYHSRLNPQYRNNQVRMINC